MKNITFFKQSTLLLSAFLLVGLLFPSCGNDDDSTPSISNKVLVPGTSVGDVNIGDTAAEIKSKWGEGAEEVINVIFLTVQTLTYAEEGIIVAFANTGAATEFDDNLACVSILVSGNYDGQTAEGIGIGSSRSDVVTAYGEPDTIDTDEEAAETYNSGIVFIYDNSENVLTISIGEI